MTTPGKPEPREGWSRLPGAVVFVALVGVVAFFAVRAPLDPPGVRPEETAEVSTLSTSPPPPPPRCRRGKSLQTIGEASRGEEEAPLAPFAPALGRAVSLGQAGYAVGMRRPNADGEMAGVLVVPGDEGVIDLAQLHGDLDPPVVAAVDGRWVASVIEPAASSLSLRLVTRRDQKLVWGAEIEQPRDESLGHDMVVGPTAGVVAWDEQGKKRSRIKVASFERDSLKTAGAAQAVSSAAVDAELPRLAERPGGFWLAYIARTPTELPDKPDDKALDRAPDEERYPAEKIEPSWIELLPLDERGAPSGKATAVTPASGHVLAFDLEVGRDGAALIAWRDDDTPSGAGSGRVAIMKVGPSGAPEVQPVADDDVGSGVPTLLGRWLALPDASGQARVAPLGDGVLTGELRLEPAFGLGQPLAARGDELLVARPAGKAVELVLVHCK